MLQHTDIILACTAYLFILAIILRYAP